MNNILNAIKNSVKEISQMLKFPDLAYSDCKNQSGDKQLKLDILSDEIITNHLNTLNIYSIISEEKDDILLLNNGDLSVAYDPLDGSSLSDVNFSVGSIFGIYKGKNLQSDDLICSVYSIYGPRLELVICKKGSFPELFRLDKNNEFKFIKELKLNEKGFLNSSGGTQNKWTKDHRNLINSFFEDGYRLRYSGAMVCDLHQILLKGGGIFSYPENKLRLLFEIWPFALIFKEAGGYCQNNNGDIFDIKLQNIHQNSECYFGSKFEISRIINAR